MAPTSPRVTTLLASACLTAAFIPAAARAQGFTPQSPEVRRLIDKGVAYLETNTDNRIGGKCLVAMAVMKNSDLGKEHPRVTEAARLVTLLTASGHEDIRLSIYEIGLSAIFLCEVDPSKYREQIDVLIRNLEMRQKTGGGFGYHDGQHKDTGDTSMTQYAVLALWAAHRGGTVDVPIETVEDVCNWLIRTQAPDGSWGYQGKDPGVGNYQRVAQSPVRPSLCAAGLGSTYICADLLRFTTPKEPEEETGLPPAFVPVVDKAEARDPQGPLTNRVERQYVRRALVDGDRWFARHYAIDTREWNFYYLYALERYMSFRETAEGRPGKTSRWYDDGVKHLTALQNEDGSWDDPQNQMKEVNTAFAVLFLCRSTRTTIEKTVEKIVDGTLSGGRGLPGDTTNLSQRGGRLVGSLFEGGVEEIVNQFAESSVASPDELRDIATEVTLSNNPPTLARQVADLRRLAKNGTYQQRMISVQALARRRNFDDVPTLIFALTDPDWRVVRAARDGLRFISRRFDGFGLPDRPQEHQKITAANKWKEWFLRVRPDTDPSEL